MSRVAFVWALAAMLVGCSRSETTSQPKPTSVPADTPSSAPLIDEATRLATRCGSDAEVVKLLARSAARTLDPSYADTFDPTWNALAHATSRCIPHGESVLRAWLGGPTGPRTAAVRALAFRARSGQQLADATVVELLTRSRDLGSPAWLALGALPGVSRSLSNTILETVAQLSTEPSHVDPNAIALLAKAGTSSVPLLGEIVRSDRFDMRARQAAVAALAQLGQEGTNTLLRLLGQPLGPRVLASILEAAPMAASSDRKRVEELARTPSEGPGRARDRVQLRCEAAVQLASNWRRELTECDPTGGVAGPLAELRVLARTPKLTVEARKRWLELVDSETPVVRQAALQRCAHQPADPAFEPVMSAALADDNPGTVAVAARLVRDLAQTSSVPSSGSALREALEKALALPTESDAAATTIALLQAGAAIGALSLKPSLSRHCDSPYPAVSAAAAAALAALRADTPCAQPTRRTDTESETALAAPNQGKVELVFTFGETAAKLTLDRSWAPNAVEQIVRLATSGHYDGLEILSPAAGILQFGDPDGDGFANGDHDPMPSELSAHPFEPLTVGLAQTGPDTGSTQLFVTLDDRPDLDIAYPILGTADRSWQNVAAGDRIDSVQVHLR